MNARPPSSVNGRIDSPSVHDLFLPKKRVIMTTIQVGMSTPAVACNKTALAVTAWRKSGMVMPAAARSAANAPPPNPPCTPTRIGVPTAPNVTAVLCTIMPNMTAVAAGNPSATSRGAATAAGVPNPAAPSMNEPNSHATMTTWTRRSSLMPLKLRRIAPTPPDRSRVCSSRMAPKMMKSRSKLRKRPCTEAATIRNPSMSHA